MGIAVDYNLHRTSVDIGKGNRQMQKAASAFSKGKDDSATNHLAEALDYYSTALDHAGRAEDDAAADVAKDLDAGKAELQKAINSYADGHPDIAEGHYESALDSFDKALDLLG